MGEGTAACDWWYFSAGQPEVAWAGEKAGPLRINGTERGRERAIHAFSILREHAVPEQNSQILGYLLQIRRNYSVTGSADRQNTILQCRGRRAGHADKRAV